MRLMMVILLASTLAPAVASPAGTRGKTPPTPHLAPHTTVLTPAEGRGLIGTGATGYWTLRPIDLQHLEKDMPRSVATYYRQYLGIVLAGKRMIFVNGFSAGVAPEFTGGKYDWHHHPVFVNDGGTAFFQATYDPRTRQFIGPHFNGVG